MYTLYAQFVRVVDGRLIVGIMGPTARADDDDMSQTLTCAACNIVIKGTFDACQVSSATQVIGRTHPIFTFSLQDIVKALFADQPFNEKYHLGAVNSINFEPGAYSRSNSLLLLRLLPSSQTIPHPENFHKFNWWFRLATLAISSLAITRNT